MRKWIAASIILSLLLAGAALADDASVKKEILADFNRAMVALKNHDLKGFMTFTADDYQATSQGMKVDKPYVERTMQAYKDGASKILSYTYEIKNLKSLNNRATGNVTFTLETTMVDAQGMMGPKGKTHRMKYSQEFTTTWTKSGAHWQRSKETSVGQPAMTLDGKSLTPGGQPTSTKRPTK